MVYRALLYLETKVTKVSRCRGQSANYASHCLLVHLRNTCWGPCSTNFEGQFLLRAVSIPSGVAGAILWPQGWLGHCPCSCKSLPLQTCWMHQQYAIRMLVYSRQTVLWLEPKQYQAWWESMDNHDNMGNHRDVIFQMVPFLFSSLLQILSKSPKYSSSLHSSGHSSADFWHLFFYCD